MDRISILKITKGNNSAKNVGGVTVVELCTLSGHIFNFTFNLCKMAGHALYCTKFCEIISNGIKVIEQTPFLY